MSSREMQVKWRTPSCTAVKKTKQLRDFQLGIRDSLLGKTKVKRLLISQRSTTWIFPCLLTKRTEERHNRWALKAPQHGRMTIKATPGALTTHYKSKTVKVVSLRIWLAWWSRKLKERWIRKERGYHPRSRSKMISKKCRVFFHPC